MNFQKFKLDLEKAEEPKVKLPTSTGSSKKAREFQKKTSIAASLQFDMWIIINCGKFLKRWEYQTT